MQTGAIVLSVGLQKVLCLRKADSKTWQFPYLHSAEADEQSATAATKQLTGLDVATYFTADHGEVKVDNEMVRLFIAAGVSEDLPDCSAAGEGWEEVRWLPWEPLQNGTPHPDLGDTASAPERQLLRPFIAFVTKWHGRHKQAFQKDEAPEEEARQLGNAALFQPSSWTGPLPREVLSSWCRQNQVDEAFYTIVDGQHPQFTCASCVLPHRAAVITPEWGYMRPEDAMDNAALMAVIFLEGGLSEATHRCKVSSVGQPPEVGPLRYVAARRDVANILVNKSTALRVEKERIQREWEALDIQLELIAEQQAILSTQNMELDSVMTPESASVLAGIFRPMSLPPAAIEVPQQGRAKRQKTAPRMPAKPVPIDATEKHPVQTLKELLDRKRWPQATVSFTKLEGADGHTCSLEIPVCGIIQAATAKSQKQAKNAAAAEAIQTLQRMGLAPELATL